MVSQLAMAHERQLIEKGSTVRLTCDEMKSVSKAENDEVEDNGLTKETIAPIKLQLVKKGRLRDQYIDIDLSKKDNPFTPES